MIKYILTLIILLTAFTVAQTLHLKGTVKIDTLVTTTFNVLLPDDSTDIRTFGDLKYVDKASTQIIPGEKTFSNTKTVFSGDSVGIRGGLAADKKIKVGSATNYLSYESRGVLQGVANGFKLHTYDPFFFSDWFGFEIDGTSGLWILRGNAFMMAPSSNPGIVSYNGSAVNATDYTWLTNRTYALYVMNGIRTDGDIWVEEGSNILALDTIYAKAVTVDSNYTFPTVDGTVGQFQRTDGSGNLYWADYSTGGALGNADSLGGLPAINYALKTTIADSLAWVRDSLAGIYSWSDGFTTPSNLLKIGKTNREIYFNNGAYSDFWLLNYIQHPYNLPSNTQIMNEFRTDYYNDTLKTFQSVANLTFLDTTGTSIWHPDGFSYIHNLNSLSVGDLPDSTTAVFNGSGVVGVGFNIAEANKTAGVKRFPMKVKGFEFKFGSTPYYTYPVVYGYYSDLTTNTPSLETAYHFYGLGNYPSYFGGDLQVAGTITSGIAVTFPDANTIEFGGDAIQLDVATLEINGSNQLSILPAKVTKWDSVTVLTTAVATKLTASDTTNFRTFSNAKYAEASHTHTEFADTMIVAVWGVMDTVTTGDYVGKKIENNYTITEVAAYTNTGTVTFNIEERVETTPNTAGVDVMTSDLVADTDQQETGTFSNAAIDRDDWLVLVVTSITGDPTIFSVTVRGVKTN